MGKQQDIFTLSENTLKELNAASWPQFLRSAGYHYKFRYSSQLLIYAQRPSATACAPFDTWTKKLGRRVNRGARGIALIDDRSDQLRLEYVFDAADTSSPTGAPVPEWVCTPEKEPACRAALAEEFLTGEGDFVPEEVRDALTLADFCRELAKVQVRDRLPELLESEDYRTSALAGRPEGEREFRELLENSITATLLYRLGHTPEDLDFSGFQYLDTPASRVLLGVSQQQLTYPVLLVAAKAVRRWDKQAQKKEEKKHEQQSEISAGRGVSDSGRDTAGAAEAEPIRETAQELSQDGASDALHDTSSDRGIERTSSDGWEGNGATGDRDDAGAAGEDTGAENGDTRLGLADGSAAGTGGGIGLSDDDLRITEEDIRAALRSGSGFQDGKERIVHAVTHLPAYSAAMADPSKKEAEREFFAEARRELPSFLREEYGIGGWTLFFPDGRSGWLDHDSKGILLRKPGAEKEFLSWNRAAEGIAELIFADDYLSEEEQQRYPEWEREADLRDHRRALAEEFRGFYKQFIDDDIPDVSIRDALHAWVWENSQEARVRLLVIFGGYAERLRDQSDALQRLAELLNGLNETPREQRIPSAVDMGLPVNFPTTEEQDAILAAASTDFILPQEELRELLISHLWDDSEKADILSFIEAEQSDSDCWNRLGRGDDRHREYQLLDGSLCDVSFGPAGLCVAIDGHRSMTPWGSVLSALRDLRDEGLFLPPPAAEKAPAAEAPVIEAGATVTLSTGDYRILSMREDTVCLQDVKHPIFTREVSRETLAVLLAAAHPAPAQEAQKAPAEPEVQDAEKEPPAPDSAAEEKTAAAAAKAEPEEQSPVADGFIAAEELDLPQLSIFDFMENEEPESSAVGPVIDEEENTVTLSNGDTVAILTGEDGRVRLDLGEIPNAENLPDAYDSPAEAAADAERLLRANAELTGPALPERRGEEEASFDETPGAEPAAPVQVLAEPDLSGRRNYRLPAEGFHLGGPKARFQTNLAAIRLLKELESSSRLATPEEQEILARYVGWGGLPQAFDQNAEGWQQEGKALREVLTDAEYAAARESTLTAFYTPPLVTEAIYDALRELGFSRGNILEPACGTGHFFGMLPEDMQESRLYGVELDSISGRIARQLYQKNNILIEGFEKTDLPDNFFDVVVGNVPFGQFKVSDKRYDKENFLIHDYFFAKALDKVRPGGVVAFITSRGTLDKENESVRRYLAQRADLLGAVRLPNNTFKENAGTEVTSDILFLQKRDRPVIETPSWVGLDRMVNDDGTLGPAENSYFAEHPEMVLGELREVSGPHGPELQCLARPGDDLKVLLGEAMKNIVGEFSLTPEEILDLETGDVEETIPADPAVRNYSYAEVDGVLYFRENSVMTRVNVGKTPRERIHALIGLRDTVRELIDAEIQGVDDSTLYELQARLGREYDAFQAKYGLINSRANSLAFSDDSSYYLLCSLEHIDEVNGEFLGKADIFYKRTIHGHATPEHCETAKEALALSYGELGRLDLRYMSRLCGLEETALLEELKGEIYPVPGSPGEYELAALYLSGNIREKLAAARDAATHMPELYGGNVTALEEALPAPLEAGDIQIKLGATWVPADYYTQFIHELLNTSSYQRDTVKVQYSPYSGAFSVSNINSGNYGAASFGTYGMKRANAYRLLQDALNLKDTVIYDTVYVDGKDKRVVNTEDTLEAQSKQRAMRDAWADWVYQDPERTETLVNLYNERFNCYRAPEYSPGLVQFHGMNPGWEEKFRDHQKKSVARILYSGNTQLATAVGGGKTAIMVAAAMEAKHLGLCRKSLVVVPNHLVGQWAAAIYDMYPAAKVLASTKKDFETKNRKKFCSRIATGDYDIVVIGHSQFERIPLSMERQIAGIEQERDDIIDAIAVQKAAKAENFTIKAMESMKKKLDAKLDKLHNSIHRDDTITFEETGVDRLFIDESHEYKNLFLYTKMTNVAGISQTDSQKASDLFLKCRYMDELTGRMGNIHATGTPLSNTMAELYTAQRYLQYDLLKETGLASFDAWASTFGETVASVELAPTGVGYRTKTRFANFYNIPELMGMYRQVADIQTADMLNLPVPEVNYETIVLKPSAEQKDLVGQLVERAEAIRKGGVSPDEDNMLCITNDGRKLALDQRLIDPTLPDNPESKTVAAADKIYELWADSMEEKLTQLVFCDLSTPKNDGFDVYHDLKDKLVARGIPASEIRFIHEANTDAAKESLFQQVREGSVRVLMGSTGKMGTGTNVQDRVIAGHDLDCPWRPSDLEQRAGRVIRTGNQNDRVHMYRYVTEGTFDAYMYQLIENKQRFVSQIFTSKTPVRSAADVDEATLSYAEIKALASGNPLVREKVELEIEISRLNLLKARFVNGQVKVREMLRKLPSEIHALEVRISDIEADMKTAAEAPARDGEGKFLPFEADGRTMETAVQSAERLLSALHTVPHNKEAIIGHFRGLDITGSCHEDVFHPGDTIRELCLAGRRSYPVEYGDSAEGLLRRLNNMVESRFADLLENCRHNLEKLQMSLAAAQQEQNKPFEQEGLLKAKEARLAEVTDLLDLDRADAEKRTPPAEDRPRPLDEMISQAAARTDSAVGSSEYARSERF